LTSLPGHARGIVATGGKINCKDVCVEVHGIQVTAAEVIEEDAEVTFKGGQIAAFALRDPAMAQGVGAYLPGEQGIRTIITKSGSLLTPIQVTPVEFLLERER
jgi:hypothetical protein